MSIQSRIAVVSFMLMSSFAWADGASDRAFGTMIQENEKRWGEYALSIDQAPPETVHYRYGMDLDIERVIHVTSANIACGPIPAQMAYKDSNGDLNLLEYRAFGTKCPRNGR